MQCRPVKYGHSYVVKGPYIKHAMACVDVIRRFWIPIDIFYGFFFIKLWINIHKINDNLALILKKSQSFEFI